MHTVAVTPNPPARTAVYQEKFPLNHFKCCIDDIFALCCVQGQSVDTSQRLQLLPVSLVHGQERTLRQEQASELPRCFSSLSAHRKEYTFR
jgi:hypothetical protein